MHVACSSFTRPELDSSSASRGIRSSSLMSSGSTPARSSRLSIAPGSPDPSSPDPSSLGSVLVLSSLGVVVSSDSGTLDVSSELLSSSLVSRKARPATAATTSTAIPTNRPVLPPLPDGGPGSRAPVPFP
jgi:hypothetical protein